MKKIIWKIFLVFVLLIIYTYIIMIQSIPTNLVLFEGEELNLKTILGLRAELVEKDEVIETLSNTQTSTIDNIGKNTVRISLFDNIFLKNINVDVLSRTVVVPVGNIAGIKLYTNGVLVVGMTEIKGLDNKKYKPYENSGIEEGDTIISINNNKIETTEELIENVNSSNGKELKLEYIHDNNLLECSIVPVETSKEEYKLGLWVRDSAARSWNGNIL